jgi:hypothetical protein
VTLQASVTVGGATMTLSLPSGLNFAFAPAAVCSGQSLSSTGFTANATTVTFTTGGVSMCQAGAAVTVNAVYLGAVNTFASAATTSTYASISFASNVPGESALAGTQTGTAVASFAPPVTFATTASGVTASVDITLGAARFVSGTTGTTSVSLGSVSYTNNVRVDVDGTAVVSVATTGVGVTVSAVTGSFNGFSSIYAATAACATVAPTSGAVSASVTGAATAVTLSGIAGQSTQNICGIVGGSTILSPTTVSVRVGSTLTNSASAASTLSSAPATITYNGTGTTLNYYVGNGSLYKSYLNVANNGGAAASVFLTGTTASGSTLFGLLDSAIPANVAKLYTPAQVATALGNTTITDAAPARISVLISGTGGSASNLVLQPTNVVIPLN